MYLCISNNLKKRCKAVAFPKLISYFCERNIEYGSVTVFSCDERRKFKHNRENKWHCLPVVSLRYRREVVAFFIYWFSYDLSH